MKTHSIILLAVALCAVSTPLIATQNPPDTDMSKIAKVHYHQAGREPIELHVVKQHTNGTLDLAREKDGEAIITGILLSKEPGDGAATAISEKSADKASKGKVLKELRATVKRLTSEAEAAQKAVDEAQGTPDDEALTKTAVEALAALEAAQSELEAAEAATE